MTLKSTIIDPEETSISKLKFIGSSVGVGVGVGVSVGVGVGVNVGVGVGVFVGVGVGVGVIPITSSKQLTPQIKKSYWFLNIKKLCFTWTKSNGSS